MQAQFQAGRQEGLYTSDSKDISHQSKIPPTADATPQPLKRRIPVSQPHQGLPSSDDEDILADLGDSDQELSPSKAAGNRASPGNREIPVPNVASPNRYLTSEKQIMSGNYETKERMKTVEEEPFQRQNEHGAFNSQLYSTHDEPMNPVIDFSGGDRRYNFQHARDPSPPKQQQPPVSTHERIKEVYGSRVVPGNRNAERLSNPAFSIGSRTSHARSPDPQRIHIAPKHRKVQSVRHSPLRSENQSTSVMETNVHQRLFEHSKQLEEKKHLKKITQHIYDETADLREVKAKPSVNVNSEKFAKRKEMYRLGSEPIQNALYRDFIYREKRKQDEQNQMQAQVQADTNRQKTNSKSYKLALKKLEKDLQDVFKDCELDHNGQLTFPEVAIIVARLGIFKIHGNQEGLKKIEQKARYLAQSIPEEVLKQAIEQQQGEDGIMMYGAQAAYIMAIVQTSEKKAAANSLLQMEQRREREEELHLQLWRYLNQYESDKIESLVLMELFKVILCQFTQNVRELASTVNDLMNIAHQGNAREIEESQQEYEGQEDNYPQEEGYDTRRQPSSGYQRDESESADSARNQSGNQFSRRSEAPSGAPSGEKYSGINTPDQQEIMANVMHGQLSGIPEETIATNPQGSVLGSGGDPRDMENQDSPYINHQRMSTGMSGDNLPVTASNIPQWTIEEILREIKALNDGTLIFKRPNKKLMTSGTTTPETPVEFQREPEQYTFQPKINARSKTVKSKFKDIEKRSDDTTFSRGNTVTPGKSPLESRNSDRKAQSDRKDMKPRRTQTDIHNRLLEVRTEYEKKKELKKEIKDKKEMEKCTFKPNINTKSKNIESRFKSVAAGEKPVVKDPKAASFYGEGAITAADLLGPRKGGEPIQKKKNTEELPQVGEYLQCTFKPELVSNFKKKILQKKVEVRGVDDAARRMRGAHESREKTKNYLESLKLGTQYEKNKQMKFRAPNLKTEERAKKSQTAPIILLDVNVGPGKTGRLVLHKGQQIESAANEFAQIYHLNDYMKQNLVQMLTTQYEEYSKEAEEEVKTQEPKCTTQPREISTSPQKSIKAAGIFTTEDTIPDVLELDT